jgi:hypothetical protein
MCYPSAIAGHHEEVWKGPLFPNIFLTKEENFG